MSEVRYQNCTVLARNVREGDVVLRVGKKVKQVKRKNGSEVSIKVEKIRRHIVLDDDRLVRIKRPRNRKPPSEKKVRMARWKRVFEEERERNLEKVGKIIAARYPKKELMAA